MELNKILNETKCLSCNKLKVLTTKNCCDECIKEFDMGLVERRKGISRVVAGGFYCYGCKNICFDEKIYIVNNYVKPRCNACVRERYHRNKNKQTVNAPPKKIRKKKQVQIVCKPYALPRGQPHNQSINIPLIIKFVTNNQIR